VFDSFTQTLLITAGKNERMKKRAHKHALQMAYNNEVTSDKSRREHTDRRTDGQTFSPRRTNPTRQPADTTVRATPPPADSPKRPPTAPPCSNAATATQEQKTHCCRRHSTLHFNSNCVTVVDEKLRGPSNSAERTLTEHRSAVQDSDGLTFNTNICTYLKKYLQLLPVFLGVPKTFAQFQNKMVIWDWKRSDFSL